MRLFNRNKAAAHDASPQMQTQNGEHNGVGSRFSMGKGKGKGPSRRQKEPYSMASRPTFGQWLKCTWLDILTMIIMGALGLGVCSKSAWEKTTKTWLS